MAQAGLPKWEQSVDYRVGLEAYELVTQYKKALEVRLPAGLIEGLKEDLGTLGAIGEEKKKGVARVKGFTGSQADALKQSFIWCLAVRDALKKGKAPEPVKKASGVGMLFPNKRVSVGVAAVNAIVETYDRFPEVFRDCGVLPDDINEGKSLLNALQTADVTQENEKAKKKDSTRGRNALRIRIEAAVDRIIGAAGMAFKDQQDVLKLFTDLTPGTTKKAPKKPAETPKAN
jgi:hypothetical protein